MVNGSHTNTTTTTTTASVASTTSTLPASSSTSTPSHKAETTAVQVALRVRPLTRQDRSQPRFSQSTNSDVIKTLGNSITVVPHQKSYSFDHVFDTASTQEQVFLGVASPLVDRFIDGYNVTILAYGQTSSGKTYSMGTAVDYEQQVDPEQEGIIPRAMAALFQRLYDRHQPKSAQAKRASVAATTTFPPPSGLRAPKRASSAAKLRPVSMMAQPMRRASNPTLPDTKSMRYSVHVSFVEIYNEELIDLLNPALPSERPHVTIREDTKGHIYWTGVKEVSVGSTEDVLRYLQMGTDNRATGSTDMNAKSSRSHAIFTVTLKQEKWIPSTSTSESKATTRSREPPSPVTSRSLVGSPLGRRSSALNVRAMVGQMEKQDEMDIDGEWMVTHSKFHFVDLAGSERLKRTAAEGDRRKEGININAGLLALGNVISALSDPSRKPTHVPYRDSKLTRLLQDSLGGNATTLMIACVSPAEINLTETANTIKYAHRARNIKNKTERNEAEEWMTNDSPDFLRSMITKLKAEVRLLKRTTPPSPIKPSPSVGHDDAHSHMSPSSSLSENDHLPLSTCPSSSATTTITVPDTPDCDSHALLLVDLRRQIEELHNELTVTRERNQLVESELRESRQGKPPTYETSRATKKACRDSLGAAMDNVDFQHLVEPVIEEYEKSISALESQLAMARAALTHSEQVLTDQESQIAKFKSLQKSESSTLESLEARLAKCMEREQAAENYVGELEEKLAKSESHTEQQQQVLTDLRQKISKFRETGDNSEQYISDLETRLALADQERATLVLMVEQTEQKLAEQEKQMTTIQRRLSLAEGDITQKLILEELDLAHDKCRALEEQLVVLREASSHFSLDEDSTPTSLPSGSEALYLAEAELRAEIDTRSRQMAELERRLADMEPLQTQLQEMRDSQADEIQQLAKQLERCKREHAVCQRDLTAQCAHNKQLQKDYDALLEQLQDEVMQNANGQRELDAARQKAKELQKHIWEHEEGTQMTLRLRLEELERVKRDMHTLRQMEAKQSAMIQCLEAKVDSVQALADTLREQLANRDQKIGKLEKSSKKREAHVASLQKELESVLRDMEGMRLEKDRLEKTIHVLEGVLSKQDKKLERSASVVQALHDQQALRAKTSESKESAVETLQAQKEELEQSLQRADEMTKMLEEELGLAKSALDEQVALAKRLEAERAQSTTPTDQAPAPAPRQDIANDHERRLREKDAMIARLEKTIQTFQTLSSSNDAHLMVVKIAQLTEDNEQLISHVDDLEAQLVLQRGQLTLETKNLELEVMKLTAANDRLEKEMESALPRSTSGTLNHRSPPPTPRISSPPPPTQSSSLYFYKPQRDWSSSSLSKLRKSGSFRSMSDEEPGRRASTTSFRSERGRPSSLMFSCTPNSLPPPSAPPSDPLPPIPTTPMSSNSTPVPVARPMSSQSASIIHTQSPVMSPTRTSFSPFLHRQNSTTSTNYSEALNSDLTSDQYEKIVHSLQRKVQIAETDVRAHQEVISKLESQLSRSEVSMRDAKKQMEVQTREKQSYNVEVETLRAQMKQYQTNEARTVDRLEKLQEKLSNEKVLKEKAEKARLILENRMEELMNKKHKFMCF